MKGVTPVNRGSAKSESPRHGKHVLCTQNRVCT